jgi:hypothetical protein
MQRSRSDSGDTHYLLMVLRHGKGIDLAASHKLTVIRRWESLGAQ